MSKKNRKNDPNHLGFGRLMAFKSSDISAGWVNVIMLNYLSIYASDALGISIGVVGTMLMASKIIDAFTDLIAGWIVDNTHSKLGKGRPYELAIIGETVCTILLFSCPPQWQTGVKCAWIFFMYTLTFSIFATLRTAAQTPYTIRHFSNNKILLRKVASYGGMITMAGSMALSITFPMLMKRIATDASGWSRLVLVIMVPATLIGLLRFFLCKEDPSVDAEAGSKPISVKEIGKMFAKNKYVWIYAIIMLAYNVITNLAAGAYFFKWYIGNEDYLAVTYAISVILLPIMMVFPQIMKKMGSMAKMVGLFAVIGVVGWAIVFLADKNLPILFTGFVMAQFGTLPLAYYGVLFIMNICTYNEIIGLPRMDASAGAMGNFCTKAGGALGTFLCGALLQAAGYISEAGVTAQPDSALMMIRIVFSIVPLVCVVIIAVLAFRFAKVEPLVNEFDAKMEAEKKAANA